MDGDLPFRAECFKVTHSQGVGLCSHLLQSDICGTSWTLLHLFLLSNSNMISFVLSYIFFVVFCYYPLRACSFLIRNRKSESRWEGGGEELGGVLGEETIVRVPM